MYCEVKGWTARAVLAADPPNPHLHTRCQVRPGEVRPGEVRPTPTCTPSVRGQANINCAETWTKPSGRSQFYESDL